MSSNLIFVGNAVVIGLGATLVMDLWNFFLRHTFKVASPNYYLVGRWLRHMPAGVFRHSKITAASAKSAECLVGWAAHYAIGIIFALILLMLATPGWLHAPTFWPSIVFGLATVVLPMFVMQPAFGMGFAASKTPAPNQARLRSVLNHAVFGLGLYLWALVVGRFFS
jgi:Protein of unknown function (DUF2938)